MVEHEKFKFPHLWVCPFSHFVVGFVEITRTVWGSVLATKDSKEFPHRKHPIQGPGVVRVCVVFARLQRCSRYRIWRIWYNVSTHNYTHIYKQCTWNIFISAILSHGLCCLPLVLSYCLCMESYVDGGCCRYRRFCRRFAWYHFKFIQFIHVKQNGGA